MAENQELRLLIRRQAEEIARLSSGDPHRRLTEKQIFEGWGVTMPKAGRR